MVHKSTKDSRYQTERNVVFAAMSKRSFYLREHIIKFILQNGYTPTCAFMMFSYFLLDTVERRKLIRANNDLIKRSDELWVFGEISDGVQKEIDLAEMLKQKIRYFKVLTNGDTMFVEIKASEAVIEPIETV
jgi:hypothetical protein